MTRSDSRPQRLYILTGEPSGEAHAARVVERIRDQWPEVEIRGMGGDAMEAQGVDLLEHVSNTAIMGFAEVVAKLGFIRTLMVRVKADILAFRPDRILIVDYPGFNLRMARWAREQGFPVDMYIGPQVWAWKRRRVHAMARDLDRLSVILPFEKAAYAGLDLDVDFVGHPLLDVPPLPPVDESATRPWREARNLPLDRPILALLPGSRLLAPVRAAFARGEGGWRALLPHLFLHLPIIDRHVSMYGTSVIMGVKILAGELP